MTRPFKLDRIKKVSKRELELTRALYEFFPATDVREKVGIVIRKSLMKHLGQEIRYFISDLEQIPFNELIVKLPQSPVVVSLGLAPASQKVFIHIDHHVANLVISKLLGGGEAPMSDLRPLTETEQGVVQYLILQILSEVYKISGSEPRSHFRFERFVFDPAELQKLAGARENMTIMTMEVSLFDQSGFVRLIFPNSLLEEVVALPKGVTPVGKEKGYFARQLARWGFFKTSIWAEAGQSMLSPLDIKDLETGDVILFDESDLTLKGKKAKGEVKIHIGEAPGRIVSTLTGETATAVKCKLKRVVKE